MNKILKKYILFSTIFCVFSEAFGLVHYAIMILNLLIFFFVFQKVVISKTLIYVYIYLLITGVYSIFSKTNTIELLIVPIAGTFISCYYFYNFFLITKYRINYIFSVYCKFVLLVCVIGICLYMYQTLINKESYRLQSIMFEPAHFCGVCLPAFYYYLKSIKKNYWQFGLILLSILLSGSSVGYLGALICIIILPSRFNLSISFTVLLFAVLIGYIAIKNSNDVSLRVNDTLKSITTFDLSDVNFSTYAFVSNYFVVTQVASTSPILGNGFGSYQQSHKKNISNLHDSQFIPEDLRDINSTDANSLFLHVLADLGIVGIFFVLYFIFKKYSDNENFYILSRAIFIYFFYKLFREGHFFSPEMYFFVMMYYFLNKEQLIIQKTKLIAESCKPIIFNL